MAHSKFPFVLNGKKVHVHVTEAGVKLNARSKEMPVEGLLGAVDKGQARKLRKALRAAGHPAKAALPRITAQI